MFTANARRATWRSRARTTPACRPPTCPSTRCTTSGSGVDPHISPANAAHPGAPRRPRARPAARRASRAGRRQHRRPLARRARRARRERPRAQPRPRQGGRDDRSPTQRIRCSTRDPASGARRRRCASSTRACRLRNPVMFVVEVGAAITTDRLAHPGLRRRAARRRRRAGRGSPFTVAVWLWLTVVFANLAEALAEGRGKAQAATLRAMRTETVARRCATARRCRVRAAPRRRRGRRGRRGDPRRRHRDRGHRLGRRVGDHRRVGAGHPRVRRRPQRGHGRHARALGPHRRRDHAGARAELPRPHDRARRGRRAAQDARTRSRSASCSRA